VARGFSRTRRGVLARLDDQERGLLAHLLDEVYVMLDDGSGGDAAHEGGGDVDDDALSRLVGIGTAVELPADPALARLLPDAHRDDAPAAAEFRRYTELGLRERKRSGLLVARRSLDRPRPLLLDEAEAGAWVVALTDVRLVLGSRLGLERDEDHDRLLALAAAEQSSGAAQGDAADGPPVGEVGFLVTVYDFLSWLQETLVQALVTSGPR
jgi:Domain of unknown function (DUF2017)